MTTTDLVALTEAEERHRKGVLTDYESVLRYVRYLMDQIELRDWAIWVAEEPSPDNSEAACWVWHRYKGVNLKLGKNWRKWEAEDARVTLLHELIHAYTVPISRSFDHLEALVGELTWKATAPGVTLAVEQATEGIALSLAPHFALPQDAPLTDVPVYRYDNDGQWFWMLDYPDRRAVSAATGGDA